MVERVVYLNGAPDNSDFIVLNNSIIERYVEASFHKTSQLVPILSWMTPVLTLP
jgi:hypothetical protein